MCDLHKNLQCTSTDSWFITNYKYGVCFLHDFSLVVFVWVVIKMECTTNCLLCVHNLLFITMHKFPNYSIVISAKYYGLLKLKYAYKQINTIF